MYGNLQDVLNAARQKITPKLDGSTESFSDAQREVAKAAAGALLAEISWKSDPRANQEKPFPVDRCGNELAEMVVNTAADFARRHGGESLEESYQVMRTKKNDLPISNFGILVRNFFESAKRY